MLTLIETNDKVSVSLSKYQRTLLAARRAHGPTPHAEQSPARSQAEELAEREPPAPPAQNRSVPLLSIPRKALGIFKSPKKPREPHDPPPQETTPAASTKDTISATAPKPVLPATHNTNEDMENNSSKPDEISPISTTPPSLPLITQALTSPPPQRPQQQEQQHNGTATGGGYQYNSSDFQVENPFADKYSTSKPDSASPETSTTGNDTSRAAPDRNNHTEPFMSSTYDPGSEYSLFDTTLPGSRPPDGSTTK